MDLAEEMGALRQSAEGRLSVVEKVLRAQAWHRRRRAGLAATVLILVVFASLWLGPGRTPGAGVARTSAPVQVQVASCPVPARDYAGTPYSPRAAPATMSVPASLAPPRDAQVFGTEFLPGPAWYLLGPQSAACQGELASADGGQAMTATTASHRPGTVTMTISPGGVGPSTDLACPYIPAVRAADEDFRQDDAFCAHPAAEVIRQIPTGTASLYAAAVFVPARVTDPNIQGSGDGTDPTVALYTARVQTAPAAAGGQMIACTLGPARRDICAASLKFFLATQAWISTQISAVHLNTMEDALASFLAGQDDH